MEAGLLVYSWACPKQDVWDGPLVELKGGVEWGVWVGQTDPLPHGLLPTPHLHAGPQSP